MTITADDGTKFELVEQIHDSTTQEGDYYPVMTGLYMLRKVEG